MQSQKLFQYGLGIKNYVLNRIAVWRGKIPIFGIGYHEWQSRRIRAMLDHYGHEFFAGKTIIELGAGFGDIGAFFAMLGAKVTCLEGRESNVVEIRRRYPAVDARVFDLNNSLPKKLIPADMIIHFGVLYHLRTPEQSLRNACQACRHMVLETECADSLDANYGQPVREYKFLKDHALDGHGCSPSPAFVERILREENTRFEMITDSRCNAAEHVYDWPINNSGASIKGRRRFWFVENPKVVPAANIFTAEKPQQPENKHHVHPGKFRMGSH